LFLRHGEVFGTFRNKGVVTARSTCFRCGIVGENRHERKVDMSRVARSVVVFGSYVFLLGVLLLVIPHVVLVPFGFPRPEEPWVRVLGVVVAILGAYYIAAARTETVAFMRWTIAGRFGVLVGFTAIVLAGWSPPALLVFGVIDAAGALWTARALRSDATIAR
jgi:hypothetical protein